MGSHFELSKLVHENSSLEELPLRGTPSTLRTKVSAVHIVLQSTEESANGLRSKRAETREQDPRRILLDVNVDCLEVRLYQEPEVFRDRRETQN